MSKSKDVLSGPDAEFDGWLENFARYVAAKTAGQPAAWTHIPKEKIDALAAAQKNWRPAYEKTLGPHTSVDTEYKNDARKAALALVRPLIQQYLKYAPVTNEDRTAMNVHNHDTVKTPLGAPATRPLITDLLNKGGFRVEVRFQDESTPTSRAIPYGDNGCLLCYLLGAERVTDYELLREHTLMTRAPYTLDLGPAAEGKTLSCAARWQNGRGVLGLWSELQYIVVG